MALYDYLSKTYDGAVPSSAVAAYTFGAWAAVGALCAAVNDVDRAAKNASLAAEASAPHVVFEPAPLGQKMMLAEYWHDLYREAKAEGASDEVMTPLQALFYEGARYVIFGARDDASWLARAGYEAVKLEVARAMGFRRAPPDWRSGLSSAAFSDPRLPPETEP